MFNCISNKVIIIRNVISCQSITYKLSKQCHVTYDMVLKFIHNIKIEGKINLE